MPSRASTLKKVPAAKSAYQNGNGSYNGAGAAKVTPLPDNAVDISNTWATAIQGLLRGGSTGVPSTFTPTVPGAAPTFGAGQPYPTLNSTPAPALQNVPTYDAQAVLNQAGQYANAPTPDLPDVNGAIDGYSQAIQAALANQIGNIDQQYKAGVGQLQGRTQTMDAQRQRQIADIAAQAARTLAVYDQTQGVSFGAQQVAQAAGNAGSASVGGAPLADTLSPLAQLGAAGRGLVNGGYQDLTTQMLGDGAMLSQIIAQSGGNDLQAAQLNARYAAGLKADAQVADYTGQLQQQRLQALTGYALDAPQRQLQYANVLAGGEKARIDAVQANNDNSIRTAQWSQLSEQQRYNSQVDFQKWSQDVNQATEKATLDRANIANDASYRQATLGQNASQAASDQAYRSAQFVQSGANSQIDAQNSAASRSITQQNSNRAQEEFVYRKSQDKIQEELRRAEIAKKAVAGPDLPGFTATQQVQARITAKSVAQPSSIATAQDLTLRPQMDSKAALLQMEGDLENGVPGLKELGGDTFGYALAAGINGGRLTTGQTDSFLTEWAAAKVPTAGTDKASKKAVEEARSRVIREARVTRNAGIDPNIAALTYDTSAQIWNQIAAEAQASQTQQATAASGAQKADAASKTASRLKALDDLKTKSYVSAKELDLISREQARIRAGGA